MPIRTLLQTTNRYLAQELGAALAGLTDEQRLYCAPEIDARHIQDVAIHAHRPVLAVAAVVAGHSWPARPVPPCSMRELEYLLEEMSSQINHWLEVMPAEAFRRPVELRWGPFARGADALANSLAHGFVHAGAIRGMRAIGGFPAPPE